MSENIRKLNKFGNYLADEARKISLYYFKKKIKVSSKQEGQFDPVTIADISIQKKLHGLIEKNYPSKHGQHHMLRQILKNPNLK